MDRGHREEVLKRINCAMKAEKRLVALVEAVKKERERAELLAFAMDNDAVNLVVELEESYRAARAEVGRLLEDIDEAKG